MAKKIVDYNMANDAMRHLKKFCQVVENMEAMIEFCVNLEQKKAALEKEIYDLQKVQASADEEAKQAVDMAHDVMAKTDAAERDYEVRHRELEDTYEKRLKEVAEAIKADKEEGIKELRDIKARVYSASKSFEDIQRAIREAQERLDGIRAKYEEFKRSLK